MGARVAGGRLLIAQQKRLPYRVALLASRPQVRSSAGGVYDVRSCGAAELAGGCDGMRRKPHDAAGASDERVAFRWLPAILGRDVIAPVDGHPVTANSR